MISYPCYPSHALFSCYPSKERKTLLYIMRHPQADGAIVLLNKQELSVDKKRESLSLFHLCLS